MHFVRNFLNYCTGNFALEFFLQNSEELESFSRVVEIVLDVVKLFEQREIFERNLVPALVLLSVQVQSQVVLHNDLLVVLHALSK